MPQERLVPSIRFFILSRANRRKDSFLKEFVRLITIGLPLGLACSFGFSMYMRSLLFGITAYDPSTIVVVAAVVTMATLTAIFVPANRAASINPVETLRIE